MMDYAMKFIKGASSLTSRSLCAFFSQAMTQERRRYGFVLERQCSLAKHYASFHEVALAALHPSVDKWREVAATREYLPQSVEDMFASRLRVNLRDSLCVIYYSYTILNQYESAMNYSCDLMFIHYPTYVLQKLQQSYCLFREFPK